jgi:hypothetical protein
VKTKKKRNDALYSSTQELGGQRSLRYNLLDRFCLTTRLS